MRSTFYRLIFLFLGISTIWSCQPSMEKKDLAIVEEKDFREGKKVAAIVAEGFELQLWAPGPLLSNAVAISVDHNGIVYVAETARRKSSDLDIREHREWMEEDLSLQTLEDTRAFHLKKLAPNLSAQNTWLEDFNEDGSHDWKDLLEQTERIRIIWDNDGNGRADHSQIFAEGFNEMLTGVAAGVLHHNGAVFLTNVPDVWRLEDLDNDKKADKKTSISHGFGIHIGYAGHDMSGLTIGPDGKVYWSIGDLGVNVVDDYGKRWAFPHEGAVMRANPDGSEFEVFAHGLRNPQELAFDAYGNLISVDNDGDHPGEHERFVHIIEGSDSGWRTYWQFGKYNLPNEAYKVWTEERLHVPYFPGQAAYITPPLALAPNGPAGLAFNPGTALGSQWKDHFFASYFTGSSANSKIQAFSLNPKGASFTVDTTATIVSGIVPTGMAFGPEGKLYINDWKDSYNKKPEGRIWQLDLSNSDLENERKQTQQLLTLNFESIPIDSIGELLAFPDQRVRLKAQFELVERKAQDQLLKQLKTNNTLLARLHAIWGIGQLIRSKEMDATPILPYFEDKSELVRAQVAKVIGDGKIQLAFNYLIQQLKDTNANARFFAAEALGKLGNPSAFLPLVEGLHEVKDEDPHLRHSYILALSRLNQPDALVNLTRHTSHFVRLGAVVALRKMNSPLVAAFLKDRHSWVVTEAARAIHDDSSIPGALEELAKSLTYAQVLEEAFLRRAINANLRLGDLASAERLIQFALTNDHPTNWRIDALWALGYWPSPIKLDRVEGRYRVISPSELELVRELFIKNLPTLINDPSPMIKMATIEAVGRLEVKNVAAEMVKIFEAPQMEVSTRIAALQTLTQLNYNEIKSLVKEGLNQKHPAIIIASQQILNQLDLPNSERIKILKTSLENGGIASKRMAFSSLAKINDPNAGDILSNWFQKLVNRNIEPGLELDILNAIDSSSFEALKIRKFNYEKELVAKDSISNFYSTLNGGNFEKGKDIFFNDNTAQCIRCHKINGSGGAAGPELTQIASQLSPTQLLESLIAPNKRIAPGYGVVTAQLVDGTSITGILSQETSHKLVIRTGPKQLISLNKTEISKTEIAPSAMPSMKASLTKTDIRDLIAYLVSLR